MNVFKKMDRISKILFSTGFIVFLFSLLLLVFYRNGVIDFDLEGRTFGELKEILKDTRLKRSGTIEWNSITKANKVNINDSVFTGEGSSATLDIESGGKIDIDENSLLILQKQSVLVEMGTISISLAEGSAPIEIKNANGVIKVSKPGKYIANANTVVFEKMKSLKTIYPIRNSYVYKDEEKVRFEWKASASIKKFVFKLSNIKNKNNQIKLNLSKPYVEISKSQLSIGINNWSVETLDQKLSSKSSFFYGTKSLLRLSSPEDRSTLLIKDNSETVQSKFSWSYTGSYKKVKVQLSKMNNFEKILKEVESSSRSTLINIDDEGMFFWRVGLSDSFGKLRWSSIRSFQVARELVIKPISLVYSKKLWNFSKHRRYLVTVVDPNKCEQYKFTLKSNGQEFQSSLQKGNKFQVEKIPNGVYSLVVSCFIGNVKRDEVKSKVKVDTTPIPKKPNILKSKNKLFVQIIKKLFSFILPSSYAADSKREAVKLEWDGIYEKGSEYQIEILEKQTNKKIENLKLKKSNYFFTPPKTGLYLWRVRAISNGVKGPFSDWGQVNAVDKIYSLESPLMISPSDEYVLEIDTSKKDFVIDFTWSKPFEDFTYTLELYSKPGGKPDLSIPLKGTSKRLSFKQKSRSFWWRVAAISKYGNRLDNKTYNSVKIVKKKPKTKLNLKYVAEGSLGGANITLGYDFPEVVSSSSSGQMSEFGILYSLGAEVQKDKHAIKMRYSITSSKQFKRSEIQIDYKKYFSAFKYNQHYSAGLVFSTLTESINYNSAPGVEVNAILNGLQPFLSVGYGFNLNLYDKISLEFLPELRVLIDSEFNNFNYKLETRANYNIYKKFVLYPYISAEYVTTNIKTEVSGSESGNIVSTKTILAAGVGLKYPF